MDLVGRCKLCGAPQVRGSYCLKCARRVRRLSKVGISVARLKPVPEPEIYAPGHLPRPLCPVCKVNDCLESQPLCRRCFDRALNIAGTDWLVWHDILELKQIPLTPVLKDILAEIKAREVIREQRQTEGKDEPINNWTWQDYENWKKTREVQE